MTAWPTGSAMGRSFNRELLYAFGKACGEEAESKQVDSWLAPGLNLQRNPLCGRNFEYYSEDPLLAGVCGRNITRGAMENHQLTVCPKHFALNEQETYRRGSIKKGVDAVNSIVQERVARELYLRPFEITIKGTEVRTVMTAFNRVNGVFTAGSADLCKKLLRDEWGFRGAVITDWGDMDIVVDGADAVHAGNDIIMPGGPPVIEQVLCGLKEGRCTREDLYHAAAHLLYFVMHSKSYREYDAQISR